MTTFLLGGGSVVDESFWTLDLLAIGFGCFFLFRVQCCPTIQGTYIVFLMNLEVAPEISHWARLEFLLKSEIKSKWLDRHNNRV